MVEVAGRHCKADFVLAVFYKDCCATCRGYIQHTISVDYSFSSLIKLIARLYPFLADLYRVFI